MAAGGAGRMVRTAGDLTGLLPAGYGATYNVSMLKRPARGRRHIAFGCLLFALVASSCGDDSDGVDLPAFRIGVAAVPITPCGPNPEWNGPITPNGVWGEEFTDENGNGVWDIGESFVDDPVSSQLDGRRNGALNRYNGIFLSGFGSNRLATGCNDDLWARTIIIETDEHTLSMTSVDLIGYLSHGTYYGFDKAVQMVESDVDIDTYVFGSTHQHEGPDSLGLWGFQEFSDGKFPRYLAFVDRMVAKSIRMAADRASMRPARTVVAATTDPERSPDLAGMQVRTGCRPPWFFDREIRSLQFAADDGETIATLINWGTHPESLEDENTLVSSDFVHYLRAKVEEELGGTAIYFSGALGAAEIVGDTCVTGADPRNEDGTNEFDRRDEIGVPRTREIGETVGNVVVESLRAAQPTRATQLDVRTVEYFSGGANPLFSFAMQAGILDLDPVAFDPANCPGAEGLCAAVVQHAITFRDDEDAPVVQIATAPGEIFPELFYGVAEHRRNDCPEADTGLPYEPSIRDAMTAPHRWLLGLSPDQFGYIVPGYDFRAAPALGLEADDPCGGQNYDPDVPRRRVPDHYHETLAVGADIAASATCEIVRLLGREDIVANNGACLRVSQTPSGAAPTR